MNKEDLTFFDFKCEKHGFLRNYLQFLHPKHLEIVLIFCTEQMTQKNICEKLNKTTNPYREYTIHRLESKLREIRINLYKMDHYAGLFNIQNTIKEVPLSKLKKIVKEFEANENPL